MNLFQDERGKHSTARALLWIVVLFTLALIVLRGLQWLDVPGEVWPMLGGMILIFGAWAGGPRMMAHFAPQLGAWTSSIASAVGKSKAEPNLFTDDERAEPPPARRSRPKGSA